MGGDDTCRESTDAGRMRLRLLGPVTLYDPRGTAVRVGGPRSQAILAVLAVQAGQVVTADRLIDQVWGDRTPASSRVTLQTYLYRLRAAGGEPAMLPRRAAGYVLHPAAVDVDVDAYAQLAQRARTAAADHRWSDAVRCAGEATALWGGDPFTGIDDVRLLERERERLRELRAENRLIALEARLELTGPADVLPELRDLVDSDRWDERARRLLVRTLYRAGRQTEALEAIAAARGELRDEYGLEPSPELDELTERILCHDPSLRGADAGAGPPAPPAGRAGPGPVVDARATGPPAGREHALVLLREAWDAARSGGQAVFRLVEGEPGVGKTHLVDHLAADVAHEATVTVGRCLDRPRLPLQPWSDLIDDPLPPSGSPEPGPGTVGQPLTDLWEVAAHRMFRDVVETVRAGTSRGAQLLVLEDLQWAEVAALRLLGFLLDRCARDPLLVVGTVRTAPTGSSPQAAAVLAALRHRPGAEVVALPGLGAADLGRALASHGVTVAPDELEALRGRTGGVPLLALEAARGGMRIVAGLLDTIGPAVEVAELLAVAGGRQAPAVLARACELDLAGLDSALSRLVESGLVRPAAAGEPVYEFSHALYRESIEARLTPLRRILLSRRLLAAADAVPGRVPVTVLARRALVVAGSGDPSDVRRARSECRRAAARSSACHDHQDAVEWLRSAVVLDPAGDPASDPTDGLAGSEEDLADPERAGLMTEYGLALRRAGSAHARPTFVRAAAVARSCGDRRLMARIGIGWSRGFFSRVGGTDHDLVATLRAAAHGAGELPDELQVMATAALAAELVWSPDGDERFALADEALDRARALGDRDVLAYVLRTRHLTVAAADTLDVRRRDTDELLDLAGPDADVGLRFESLFHRTGPAIGDGEPRRVQALLDEAGRIADVLAQPTLRWQVDWSRASLLLWRGELAGAGELSDETAARAASTGHAAEAATFRHAQRMELCRLQGGLDGYLPALLDRPAGGRDAFQVARYLVAAGRPDAASAHLDAVRLRGGRLALRRDMMERPSLDNLVHLADRLHRPDLAAAAAARLEPVADTFGHMIVAHPVGQHWLGVAELAQGRPARAVTRLRRAVARHEECGLPVAEAESRAELARAHDELGETDLATAERSRAVRIAAQHGAGELARSIGAAAPGTAVPAARRPHETVEARHG